MSRMESRPVGEGLTIRATSRRTQMSAGTARVTLTHWDCKTWATTNEKWVQIGLHTTNMDEANMRSSSSLLSTRLSPRPHKRKTSHQTESPDARAPSPVSRPLAASGSHRPALLVVVDVVGRPASPILSPRTMSLLPEVLVATNHVLNRRHHLSCAGGLT